MIKLKYLYLLLAITCATIVAAEEVSEAQPPPEIVIDAPPPTQSPVKHEVKQDANQEVSQDTNQSANQSKSSAATDTVTTYDSKVLPGFRPCTTEDYRNQDTDPVACQDEENARVISTRDSQAVSGDPIVEDAAVPQGNIFKLKFERFKKKKTQ